MSRRIWWAPMPMWGDKFYLLQIRDAVEMIWDFYSKGIVLRTYVAMVARATSIRTLTTFVAAEQVSMAPIAKIVSIKCLIFAPFTTAFTESKPDKLVDKNEVSSVIKNMFDGEANISALIDELFNATSPDEKFDANLLREIKNNKIDSRRRVKFIQAFSSSRGAGELVQLLAGTFYQFTFTIAMFIHVSRSLCIIYCN